MNAVLTVYRYAVPALAVLLLGTTLVFTSTWLDHLPWVAAMIVAIAFTRREQLPVTKYAAVHLVGAVSVAGALVLGPAGSALALGIGLAIADSLWLRRGGMPAWINASREVLALLGAYGWYAWLRVPLGAGQSALDGQSMPAIAVFVLVHFLISRGMY